MTFSYNVSTPDDITRIRYAITDTDEATAIFQDEEINFVLSEEGSVGAAVVSLIETIIRQLAHEPDSQQDWLRVDWRRSQAEWRKILADQKRKYGIGTITSTSTVKQAYRPDSLQKTTPDYEDEP